MAQYTDSGDDSISRERLTSTGSSERTRRAEEVAVVTADGVELNLGPDGLGLWSENWESQDRARCYGLPFLSSPSKRRNISYERILWAEVAAASLAISYVKSVSKAKIRPVTETFPINESDIKQIDVFVRSLRERAYGQAQQRKRIKVVINPFGGKGKAMKYWTREIEPIFRAARCEIEVVTTTHSRHAEEIGEEMDIEKVDVVACCSGDGVPYEIWNGLGRKQNARIALAKVAVVQLPCGSGNAQSLNCNGTDNPSKAALATVKAVRTPIDLASVTQGEKRTLSFLSQAIGIVAESDLDTEHMRWMGSARFTVGFLQRLFGKTVWPCDIAVGVEMDDKHAIEADYHASQDHHTLLPDTTDKTENLDEGLPPLRYGTFSSPLPSNWTLTPFPNLGNFYAGNMPFMNSDTNFFPFARVSDGMLDLVTIRGDLSFFKSLSLLFAVGDGRLYKEEVVNYSKVSGFRIVPREKEGSIAVDGERYPFEGLQVEVHRGLGCTLTPAGAYVLPN